MRTESAPRHATYMALVVAICALLGSAQRGAAESLPEAGNPHGSYREECSLCHGPEGWKPATISEKFDHGASGFALSGAHAATRCTNCHGSLEFRETPSACMDCHEDIHQGELGTACDRCHDTRSFLDRTRMQREHSTFRFPLTGAHLGLDCQSCHTPQPQGHAVYLTTPTECMACHRADYDATSEPDHGEAGFSTDCASCHGTTTWVDASYDHASTDFPLTGAHKSEPCSSCHGDGVYDGKDTDCFACHADDYNSASEPNHREAGFPTECTNCHDTKTWTGATFDHDASDFPLTGAHKSEPCSSCHGDGVYQGKDTECYACHADDFNAASDPDHGDAGFPHECATCHSTQTWVGATFNHSNTDFPLSGAHAGAACRDCHGDGVYQGKSTLCVDCHRDEYTQSTAPHHVAAHFATTCEDCHSTNSWSGGQYDHAATDFPLTGAHRAAACSSCHADAVYQGKSDDCYDCHKAEYDDARDPNHRTAGFPTDCAACHGTNTWDGATFDHDDQYFPIYSGKHRGEWSACSDCHTNANQYSVFDCLGCHPHSDKRDTDSEHKEISGYSYTSAACYRCHPSGTED